MLCVWSQTILWWFKHTLSSQPNWDLTPQRHPLFRSPKIRWVFFNSCFWRGRQSWFQLLCAIVWGKDELVHIMCVFEGERQGAVSLSVNGSRVLWACLVSIFSQISKWPCTNLMLDEQWSLQLCIQTPEPLTQKPPLPETSCHLFEGEAP